MIISLLSLLTLTSASKPHPPAHKQKLFCYWESWNQNKVHDFANNLDSVPIKTKKYEGCDVLIIAFNNFKILRDCEGRPSFGFINEQTADDNTLYVADRLREDIDNVHKQGGKVYVSLGGATFSTQGVITTNAKANAFIDDLADALKCFDLDGVDFSHMSASTPASIQTRMILRLAKKYSAYKIMYTIPAMGSLFAPWSKVLEDAGDKIDYVQNLSYDYYWCGYDLETDLAHLLSIIKCEDKIVIGIMPGCHDNDKEPKTSVKDAKNLAKLTIKEGYAGIAIWSANRDTCEREGYSGCPYYTGEAPGTYIKAVSKIL